MEMDKRTKIIVIVCVSVFVLTSVIVLVPIVLAGVAFGGVTIFNFSKPDMSDDELIPSDMWKRTASRATAQVTGRFSAILFMMKCPSLMNASIR